MYRGVGDRRSWHSFCSAQSQVLGVILLVGFVISAGGMAYVSFGGFTKEMPTFSKAHAEGSLQDGTLSYQTTISLVHTAGEDVDVSDMEVVIETPKREARLVDLPLKSCPTTADINSQHTEGDTIFQAGCQWGDVLIETTDDTWGPGDEMTLSMSNSDVPSFDSPETYSGEKVTVKIVDISAKTVVAEEKIEIG